MLGVFLSCSIKAESLPELGAHTSGGLASQLAPGLPFSVSLPPEHGITSKIPTQPVVHVDSGGLSSRSPACSASTLPTEPSLRSPQRFALIVRGWVTDCRSMLRRGAGFWSSFMPRTT